ncbi:MAG: squalene--hopene cyclase [Gemmatimonadetes bacterium]|nr:MAG: squalene--hopene cyclase [Gemmatimonadota bacterium]
MSRERHTLNSIRHRSENCMSVGRAADRGAPNSAPSAPTLVAGLDPAIERARERLLGLQHEDGHWRDEIEGDAVLEAEYVLLLHFFGRAHEPRAEKLGEYLRRQQGPHGGWSLYHGGPPDVSSSTKAYFVLKLLGDSPDAPHMVRARETIRSLGGVEATNTYTKIYLAIFGQYPWERCPAIPPEMVLLPDGFHVSLNAMSSWSRGIFVPLSVIWALRPLRVVPDYAAIPELFVDGGRPRVEVPDAPLGRAIQAAIYGVDRGIKTIERLGLTPLRRKALAAAERWIRERLEQSDGLGAIFPAIVNAAMALRALGLHPEHPHVRGQLEALEGLEIDLGDAMKIQPCHSPVWDTANTLSVLLTSGLDPSHEACERAARWLVDHEVRRVGDWRTGNPEGPVGGWYFEYANEFYPDCDDTAEVLSCLARVRVRDRTLRERVAAARRRGLAWLLSMQNRDGGWAAFDRGCDLEVLTLVPFADHNAMIDPSCEDITGRVLTMLSYEGWDVGDPVVQRAVRYLHATQQPDGSWFGRWGCNYIYGTWLALSGLSAIGVDMAAERYRRAADWLASCQNDDGGWGESLASYDDPALKGIGPSTATQTAWALLGLVAAGRGESEAVRRGVAYLLDTQRDDGTWDDPHWTGTGFPRVFYLRYHMYDDYFPLLALARCRDALGRAVEADRDERAAS